MEKMFHANDRRWKRERVKLEQAIAEHEDNGKSGVWRVTATDCCEEHETVYLVRATTAREALTKAGREFGLVALIGVRVRMLLSTHGLPVVSAPR